MAGPGGGPSRRSHTKSRKGCKTCKKRHIRCDETFPQCRNCTKHQVRCDYMDSPTVQLPDTPRSPQQPDLLWTPQIDATVEHWRRTGEFPFPELGVYPQPVWSTFSKTDLRLIHHLASISNETFRNRTSKLTVWCENMPKFLSVASSNPFVMHSILAFSASHLTWISRSSETRNLAYHHYGVALKGLHEAIGNFSKMNSDAVLAASLLLSWQTMDWRGWASLMTGIKAVINSMQPWRHESLFADYIAEIGPFTAPAMGQSAGAGISTESRREHLSTLQVVYNALQRVQLYLPNQDQEIKWIEQLKGYIDRLRAHPAAQTAEEQFSQLYALRKWLFWVPISLLSDRRRDVNGYLALAYFYATALALEPMFPDIGMDFCANLALPPLDELIRLVSSIQSAPGYSQSAQAASLVMDFPRDTASAFRDRREWQRQQAEETQNLQQSPHGLESINLDLETQIAEYGYGASLSPAFAPSPLAPSPLAPSPLISSPLIPSPLVSSPLASSPLYPSPYLTGGPRSPFLEVPRSSMDTYGGGSSYTTPLASPAAPPPGFLQEENVFNFGVPYGFPGGFVASPTVWT